MNICLFTREEINRPLKLDDERAVHLIKILHKKAGDKFTAGIIGGKAGSAVITEISDGIYFTFTEESDGKQLNPLVMIIGFPRPIQLKRLLRDVAALGVKEVHLTGTDLGEKSYMQSTLVEKGNAYKMLLDGTVQAGSTHVPELFLHKNLDECLEKIGSTQAEKNSDRKSLYFALDNVQPKTSLKEALHAQKLFSDSDSTFCDYDIVAAIGSERGWTDREREVLKQHKYILCGMGERIMRTETAATVSGAIILNEIGALR